MQIDLPISFDETVFHITKDTSKRIRNKNDFIKLLYHIYQIALASSCMEIRYNTVC